VRATAGVLLATHEDCARHRPFPGHPERPERLGAAIAGANEAGAGRLSVDADGESALAALARVHDRRLALRLREACSRAPAVFDSPDNPISPGSYLAAIAAVRCALAAATALARGAASNVFVAARPPGHHALRNTAMGFCFFNNAAVAAEELLAQGLGPVAIVDFDVHHGNGTQAHFWERPEVFYLSVHRYPFFPGSGEASEIGAGRGRGFTRNFPMAEGADDAAYGGALAAGLEEIAEAFRPSSWVVSAGFDAHRDDPLGGMAVTDEGFRSVGAMLRLARGGSPLVAVLEGGYNLEGLRRSVRAFVTGLIGAAPS
jgi:acetoin utilization deacetylase AcuC-like enzyme